MSTAHVVYARGRTIGSALIRWFPDSGVPTWSHAGVIIKPPPGYDEPPMIWEARFGHRFGPRPWDDFAAQYPTHQVVRYEVPDLAAGEAWLEQMRGAKYATLTVLGLALGINSPRAREDHCIEAVENYLLACGLHRWRSDHHRIKPNASYNNLMGVA